MPEFTTEQLSIAVAAVGGVALIAFLVVLILAFRVRRVRKEYAVLRGDKGEQDVVAAAGRALTKVNEIDRRLQELASVQHNLGDLSRRAIQKFGMVRYDAFEDMGGRLSFSLALLDDHGDGFVVTSINGRTEARTYIKPIVSHDSQHNLSDEEREAIGLAVSSSGRGTAPAVVSQPQ